MIRLMPKDRSVWIAIIAVILAAAGIGLAGYLVFGWIFDVSGY
jgi:hypothetical protein